MTKEEMNKRQISFKGWNLHDHLPLTNSIITVVYADFDNIFMFDSTDLSEQDKINLIQCLISEIQSGTNYTREIVKQVSDTYFVY